MGIMGLRHLLYIAETHTSRFQKIVKGQMEKEKTEEQYPVCAVGINLSQMMMKLFRAEDEGNRYIIIDNNI